MCISCFMVFKELGMNKTATIPPHAHYLSELEFSFRWRLWRFILISPLYFGLNIVVCYPLFIACYNISNDRLVGIIHSLLQLSAKTGNYLCLDIMQLSFLFQCSLKLPRSLCAPSMVLSTSVCTTRSLLLEF